MAAWSRRKNRAFARRVVRAWQHWRGSPPAVWPRPAATMSFACMRRRSSGSRSTSRDGAVPVKLDALTEPGEAKPVDWVLLCNQDAIKPNRRARWLAQLMHAIDPCRGFAKQAWPCRSCRAARQRATVLPVIVYYNGRTAGTRSGTAASRVRSGSGRLLMTKPAGASPRFSTHTPASDPDAATTSRRWSGASFLINAVANPITTLTLQRAGGTAPAGCAGALSHHPRRSGGGGARRGCQTFADDEPARAMATLFTFSGELGTSMYFRPARRPPPRSRKLDRRHCCGR